MLSRRSFVLGAGGTAAAAPAYVHNALAAGKPVLDPLLAAGLRDAAVLEALPGKVPLIKLTYRPPNFETPLSYFKDLYTPNEAFFVRYHLANIPEADVQSWRLAIGGPGVTTPLELTLDALKTEFEPVEIAAVCQCSGNRRGLFQPHVWGAQWGYGAMGNARWKGARLKDILAKAGIKPETVEVSFDGADTPPVEKTPDFIKSIPAAKALDGDTLVAYEMNGAPLPHFNGFPARIVVPGWTATYWVKHVVQITARTEPETNFWMKTAYRVPLNRFPMVQRFLSQETAANTPITEMMVNSVIASPAQGEQVKAGKTITLQGVAWDGGYGIRTVEISADGGVTWQPAKLGADAGRYSFRTWTFTATAPKKKGTVTFQARASNVIGQTQTESLIPNPAGYHHNLMHRVAVGVA